MSNMARFMIVYVLFAGAALFIMIHSDRDVPINRSFSEFPEQVKSWQMSKRSELNDKILSVLKPTDYLFRQYKDNGKNTVNLYIGYHSGGKNSGGIHSPKHCLPGAGWYEISTRRSILEIPGGTINLVRAVYQKGENRELFLYWFQVRDRSFSDEYSLKAAEIINSVLYKRRDESFIRVSVPFVADIDQATATGEQFIRDFEPVFREYLPR